MDHGAESHRKPRCLDVLGTRLGFARVRRTSPGDPTEADVHDLGVYELRHSRLCRALRLVELTSVAAVVVLLRGDGIEADRRRTMDALDRNTSNLEICFLDTNNADSNKLGDVLSREHEVLVIGSGSESGAASDWLAWEVVQQAPDADVVLLEVGSAVGPQWCEQLREAAYEDAVIATSSAIPAHMLALHDLLSNLQSTGDSSRGAAMGEPLWGCVYVRRDALNIASGARWSFQDREDTPPLPLEEFVLVPGLVHVLAPAVVTGPDGQARVDASTPLTPAIRRALATIEAAIEPLRVTVDLRCCASPLSGTQVHALNLAASLARLDELRLSVLTPPLVHDSVQPHLDALPSRVTRHPTGRAIVPSPHVFHRPYQLLTENEITDVVASGGRLVVTHQDMILDRTPAYFASRDEWRDYTARTAVTFVAADEVAFFSEHARGEAVRDGLIDERRTSVVPPGTDHLRDTEDGVMPAGLRDRGPDVPFVLIIGNAYFHKNRVFALRVSDELRKAYGWEGITVFAGGDPGAGSSGADESEFLRERPELGTRFVDLPHVSDAERHWLYTHAALVLFPTLYEGFGLVPFEAAAAGTPCVYSDRSSVAEFLPTEGALLDLGDVVETARRLHTVLASGEASDAIVAAIRHAGAELTWKRTAESYLNIYRRAMTRPVGLSLALGRELAVGPNAQMVSSNTERRVLLVLRRSTIARRIADAVVGGGSAARRLVRRFSRV